MPEKKGPAIFEPTEEIKELGSSAAGLPPMGCGWGDTLRQEADRDAHSTANACGRRGNSPPARELESAKDLETLQERKKRKSRRKDLAS